MGWWSGRLVAGLCLVLVGDGCLITVHGSSILVLFISLWFSFLNRSKTVREVNGSTDWRWDVVRATYLYLSCGIDGKTVRVCLIRMWYM